MLTNAEERERKSRIAAIAGTITVHLLIVVSLMFLALRNIPDSHESSSVELYAVSSFDSTGDVIQMEAEMNPETKAVVSTKSAETKKFDEKAVTISLKIATEKPKPVSLSKPKAIVETPDERTVIHKISDVGKKNSNSNNLKTTPKSDDKIITDVATVAVKFDDRAGNGIGVWFELAGRGYISLPKPAIDKPVEGKISVSVIVNKDGKVIFAKAGARGTTISDIYLRLRAENTARKTIFESNKKAPDEQRGTIIYVFEK
jgi:hypothetical protein